jgi:hypothetical protein
MSAMKKLTPIGVAILLALSGCVSEVDREAMSFPDMPSMPIYHRADGRSLSSDQAIDALQTAEITCRTPPGGSTAASPVVGSPAFDRCMQAQGYRRVQ